MKLTLASTTGYVYMYMCGVFINAKLMVDCVCTRLLSCNLTWYTVFIVHVHVCCGIHVGAESCLEGLTFVITGVLESLERDEATDIIKKYGGKVTTNISGRTSYVIVGEEAGESKLAKVTQLEMSGACDAPLTKYMLVC